MTMILLTLYRPKGRIAEQGYVNTIEKQLQQAVSNPFAGLRRASGCLLKCNWAVAGSNLGRSYFAPRYTQPSIPLGR